MNKVGHGRRLTILALLAVVVQWDVASRAPLVSLDGLRFLRLARWIDARGLTETLERSGQHPLYPMATFGVQKSLALAGGTQGPESWQRSGRLTAAAAVVLLVIPLYGIGLMLFSPAVAFLGTALFVLLPETARLGADALSDSIKYSSELLSYVWRTTDGERLILSNTSLLRNNMTVRRSRICSRHSSSVKCSSSRPFIKEARSFPYRSEIICWI